MPHRKLLQRRELSFLMSKTIAVIFDFDDTLAPDSTTTFLQSIGVDVQDFWTRRASGLTRAGWDPVLAYLYEMVKESESRPLADSITRQRLADWGPQVKYFKGVTRIFNSLRKHVEEISQDLSIEFYLISSGLREILVHTRIANNFTDIWASDFEYDGNDRILFPKNTVSFTDKTRYLFQVQKGIFGPESRENPFLVNKKANEEDIRVPFDQMIFVGDGYTDIPCFTLVRKSGGFAIGVYNSDSHTKWRQAWEFIQTGRVSNLVRADYSKDSSLRDTLLMATESIARRILAGQS
jgi:hypothetical protein